jgi:hypothetical protein
VRAYFLPPGLLAAIRRGTRGMGVALAKAMVFSEDPDLEVRSGEETDRPPSLQVLITSESVHDEVTVNPGSVFAEAVAISIMIADLITVLRRDHPEAIETFDLAQMVADLLERGGRLPS